MYHLPVSQRQDPLPVGSILPQPHYYRPHCGSASDLPSSLRGKYVLPINRPPTPPPDMSTLSSAPQPQRYQEHEYYYGNRYAAARGPAAQPHIYSHQVNEDRSRPTSSHRIQHVSQPPSPVPRHPSVSSVVSQRQNAQAYQIAPSLQIPRTVNSSQGSLAELAAQITCLFWFESSAVLDFAEDPSSAAIHPQPVVSEAIPTTGFRKWVTTILSTTQVAQNVILLAMLFIYRLKKQNPSVKGKLGSEYRLLTVALMLGNKFLDDNTYTNKTWAEVSGISVMEVHIMEVEFLSNMKYNLFTSEEDWRRWQTLLGRFASFVDRASRPPPAVPSPRPNQYLPPTLPSPPNSFQASPPYSGVHTPASGTYVPSVLAQISGPTPRPSPLSAAPALGPSNIRKRSLEDYSDEPPAKRSAFGSPAHRHQHTMSNGSSNGSVASQPYNVQRRNSNSISFPQIHVPPPVTQTHTPYQEAYYPPQLPPLHHALRPTLPPSTWAQPASAVASFTNSTQTPLHYHSRPHSPYLSSAEVSPRSNSLRPMSEVQTHAQPSPSVRGSQPQRNSPYKPMRGVSTLLVPPPPRAMHQPENVGYDQMHYQPLGRPIQERQQGRLPYIAQNQHLDAYHQKVATPLEQWPQYFSFRAPQQNSNLAPRYG